MFLVTGEMDVLLIGLERTFTQILLLNIRLVYDKVLMELNILISWIPSIVAKNLHFFKLVVIAGPRKPRLMTETLFSLDG